MSVELVSKFTEAEARQITDELKADYTALQAKIADAWRGRVWLALGYDDWQEYLDEEFQNVSLRPPKELQEQVIAELRSAGMSTRGIVAATELSKGTVGRALETPTAPNGAVETVIGLDGKKRPASMPKQSSPRSDPSGEPTVVDAEVVDDDDGDSGDSPAPIITCPLGGGVEPPPPPGIRPASALGLKPITLNLTGTPDATTGEVHVGALVREMHSGGSAPLLRIRDKARTLQYAFESKEVALDDLDMDALEDMLKQVADTIAVLTDLLSEAETKHSRWADEHLLTDTLGSISKSLKNLHIAGSDLTTANPVTTNARA